MKTLYIIRHAKSDWNNPGLRDFERPLNKRGLRDAPFMGKKLVDLNVAPELIVCSPANRTTETVKLIGNEIGYPIDNVLFNKHDVSGMIDFYYSCRGFLIYDLAVVANDWCCDRNGKIIKKNLMSLLAAYDKQRKIQENEKQYWRHALISASLRFFLSRLLDLHYPKIGEMTHIKDPNVFENILMDRMNNSHVM